MIAYYCTTNVFAFRFFYCSVRHMCHYTLNFIVTFSKCQRMVHNNQSKLQSYVKFLSKEISEKSMP